MDEARLTRFLDRLWDDDIVPTLIDYIRIPNKSPAFDPDWVAHGHMETAVALLAGWARAKLAGLPGARLEIVRLPGRTPVILIDLPGEGDDTVLLYGHLDKQPEMTGWAEGMGPWTPVLKGDRLYGRGGADDGYALFGALAAVLALKEQGVARARAVILIEACEESGSYDLPHYVDHLAPVLGQPALVVCLDSGCGNYEQLWLTTSLRGLVSGTLKVRVLEEGVHSGDASGVVPSSFRLLRRLLSRLEDETSGAVLPPALHVAIPAERVAQARIAAAALGPAIYTKFPFAGKTRPMAEDLVELVLNRTWRPQLAVTGIEGLPAIANAGNVLLPETQAKLSLRLPPTLDAAAAGAAVAALFAASPPDGAEVSLTFKDAASGWNAPALAPWLERSLARASEAAFGQPPAYMGEGGSIPFMAMLGAKFPAAQFVVTGVLGPHSNAHGPNEFLHLPTAKRISAVIAQVLRDQHAAD
ncbi:MAG TPA: M20/M25/M40 family metallo-hydrolase [Stellaceae bacterium]|jgi:acetylornithine deacetylase/succinyl-diaminopimelate desuccinylase-like protein|nr:M20/M25/M40 family metallo-hydrolase [Stellaceae bacterium]